MHVEWIKVGPSGVGSDQSPRSRGWDPLRYSEGNPNVSVCESAAVFSGKHLKIIKGVALPVLPASPAPSPPAPGEYRISLRALGVFWGELAAPPSSPE